MNNYRICSVEHLLFCRQRICQQWRIVLFACAIFYIHIRFGTWTIIFNFPSTRPLDILLTAAGPPQKNGIPKTGGRSARRGLDLDSRTINYFSYRRELQVRAEKKWEKEKWKMKKRGWKRRKEKSINTLNKSTLRHNGNDEKIICLFGKG